MDVQRGVNNSEYGLNQGSQGDLHNTRTGIDGSTAATRRRGEEGRREMVAGLMHTDSSLCSHSSRSLPDNIPRQRSVQPRLCHSGMTCWVLQLLAQSKGECYRVVGYRDFVQILQPWLTATRTRGSGSKLERKRKLAGTRSNCS